MRWSPLTRSGGDGMAAAGAGYLSRMWPHRRHPHRCRLQGRRGIGTLAAALLPLLVLSGCTGRPSSTSAWQGSSDRVIGTAISGLGTARIVVVQDQSGHLPHSYTVVAATDAIDTTAQELSGYVTGQPPDALHAAQYTVTDALQQTIALLGEVRVELASPGVDRRSSARLLARIDALRRKLDDLQSGVTSSPPTVSAR